MLQRNNPSQLRNLFSYNRKKASAVTNRSLRFTVHCHHIRTQISTRSSDVFRSIKIKPVDETLSLLISLEKREQKGTSLWGARVNQVNQRLSSRRREKGALHGVQNRDLWRVCGPWTPVEHIPPSPSPRETRRMTTDVGTGAPGRRCRPPRLVTKPENMCFGCLMAEGRDPLPPSAFSSLSLSPPGERALIRAISRGWRRGQVGHAPRGEHDLHGTAREMHLASDFYTGRIERRRRRI